MKDECTLAIITLVLWITSVKVLPITIPSSLTSCCTNAAFNLQCTPEEPSCSPNVTPVYTILAPAINSSLFCDDDDNCSQEYSTMSVIDKMSALENFPYKELFMTLPPLKSSLPPHEFMMNPLATTIAKELNGSYDIPPIFVLNLDRAPN